MGMGIRIDSENPMSMGVDMWMTFEDGYGCGYSTTIPVLAACPSLG